MRRFIFTPTVTAALLPLAEARATQSHATHQQLAAVATGSNSVPLWVWCLFAGLVIVFSVICILIRYYSRKKLQTAYDMLETSYAILEMSNNELVQANKDLQAATARAEEASKMKTNFIQQISHEIRTPLNILSGFTQLITTPGMALDEDSRNDINRQISDNTNRITNLVNKMLELSDVNSQTVIEKNDNVPAVQIAAEAVDASGITTAPHLTFDLQWSPEAETLMLQTNQRTAVRALSLVLDNARKFTAPAEAHQQGGLAPATDKKRALLNIAYTTDEPQQVAFIVEDTGIGVPPEEAERIFDEFVQLDDYYDGTGIGLTVARSLVRRLGGDLLLDTAYTDGARFVLTLPVAS